MTRRYATRHALELNLLEAVEEQQFVRRADVLNFSQSTFQATAYRLIAQGKLEKVAHGVYAKPGTAAALSPLERLYLVHPLAQKVAEELLARWGEWTPTAGQPDGRGYKGLRYLSGAPSDDSYRNALRALVQAGAVKAEVRKGRWGYVALGAVLEAATIERSEMSPGDKALELDYLAYREQQRVQMARRTEGTPEWNEARKERRGEMERRQAEAIALADLLS